MDRSTRPPHVSRQVFIKQFLKYAEPHLFKDWDYSDVTFDTKIVDLGMDSLDLIELLIGFEEDFGVIVEDSEAVQIKTVGQAILFYLVKMEEKNVLEEKEKST